VDSGSSATFISARTVEQLGYAVTPAPEVQVAVASGGKMTSTALVPEITWWSQGHTFTSAAWVLELPHYDMILGMDLLECHSPMWIHWKRKMIRFTQNGKRIALHGVKDYTSQCLKLKTNKLKGLVRRGAIAQLVQLSPITKQSTQGTIPQEIQQVITSHEHLFHCPASLPPHRPYDH
jgi:hypothetical protein